MPANLAYTLRTHQAQPPLQYAPTNYAQQPKFVPVDFKQKFGASSDSSMRTGSYPVLHPAPTFYPLKAPQPKTKVDAADLAKQPPDNLYEKVPMLNQATGRHSRIFLRLYFEVCNRSDKYEVSVPHLPQYLFCKIERHDALARSH